MKTKISLKQLGQDVLEFSSDHRQLSNRDSEEQHPIEAISGLNEISNKRMLELWNGVMNNE